MIIGKREENVIEKMHRHKEETKEQIKGWKAELELVMEKDGEEYKKYQSYCEFMIKIWENTLEELNKLGIE